MYKGDWYWWSVDVEDMLTEYGESEHDKVAECIEITAWQPLPEPWKGENI